MKQDIEIRGSFDDGTCYLVHQNYDGDIELTLWNYQDGEQAKVTAVIESYEIPALIDALNTVKGN